jgi:hypothetical protein
MEDEKLDLPFYQLVLSLQAATMQQLGKVISPITGKAERDLVMAKGTIDLLEMFQRKTVGNLDDDEKKLIEHVLYELRLNYVDELKRESGPSAKGEAPDLGGQTTH